MRKLIPFLMAALLLGITQCTPGAPVVTPSPLPSTVTPMATPVPTYPRLPTAISTPTPTATRTPLPTATHAPLPTSTPMAVISVQNASQVTQLAQWGNGGFTRVVYSPDGKLVAVATANGIHLYDAQTLAELRLVDSGKHVVNMVFSPDSQVLASTSGVYEPGIRLWRVSDGTPLTVLDAYPIFQMAFAPDGESLATGGIEGVGLWQVSTGVRLRTLTDGQTGSEVVAFAPDGKTLVSGSYGQMQLWRLSDGVLLNTFSAQESGFTVTFSPDSRTVALTGYSGVQLWNVKDGVVFQRELDTQGRRVSEVHFSPDGQTLAAGGEGLWLWRVKDRALLSSENLTSRQVVGLGYTPEGDLRVAEFDSPDVRFWQMSDNKVLGQLKAQGTMSSVAFAPDGQTLVTGDCDGAKLWRVADGTLVIAFDHASDCWSAAAVSPDGQQVALVTRENRAVWWRISDGQLEQTLKLRRNWPQLAFAFAPDEFTLAWGAADGTLQLWRLRDSTVANAWQMPDKVSAVAFSPDGQVVAAAAAQKIWLFQTRTGKEVRSLETEFAVTALAFAPDGRSLAASGDYAPLRVWRLNDAALVRTLDNQGESRSGRLLFTPDGLALVIDNGFDLELWRISDGQLVQTLKGHTDWITGMAFSPDGTRLASTSEDGTLRLWGLK